jgi:saccharopine dehydrogenase-like NADP-dependent oxidoreductase
MTALRVLIVGGYGTFGGRLARLLAGEPRLTLIIAGRSPRQAEQFCAALPATAALIPAAFDRAADIDAQLGALAPDLVVDASGPFQIYHDPYRVVRAVLARRIGYLDLADGSDFVQGIAQFDAQARERGVFVLGGASSFPVLTAAVVRRLARGMARVDAVSAGIAPSPFAGLGLNVVRAIASYCGKPIELLRDGRKVTGFGLTESRRFTIAPPGRLPLGSRRFSLVDAPDLRVLPALWPLREIWMGAGTVPEIMHRVLNLCAWGRCGCGCCRRCCGSPA